MNEVNQKSGFKTSEFYVTVVSAISGLLIMLGYLSPQQADAFVQAVVAVIGGVMVVASTIVYIVGRIKVKQQVVKTSTLTSSTPISDTIEGLSNDLPVYPR